MKITAAEAFVLSKENEKKDLEYERILKAVYHRIRSEACKGNFMADISEIVYYCYSNKIRDELIKSGFLVSSYCERHTGGKKQITVYWEKSPVPKDYYSSPFTIP